MPHLPPRARNAAGQHEITMNKIPSVALFVAGIVLLVYGLDASNSVSSSVSQAVSGTPTDKSIWLIVLGVLGILSGTFGLFLRKAP